jgi:hypothetical protein
MEHGYYGRLEGIKPKKGVEYFMFEEAMQKKLAECLSELTQETKRIYKQHEAQIEKLIKESNSLNQRFGFLLKIFEKDELKEKARIAKFEGNDK